MKNAVLLSLLFISVQLIAQVPGGGRAGGQQLNGRFYGKVVDAANKGVDAASVILVQQRRDSVTRKTKEVVAGGMLTSTNGEFSI